MNTPEDGCYWLYDPEDETISLVQINNGWCYIPGWESQIDIPDNARFLEIKKPDKRDFGDF